MAMDVHHRGSLDRSIRHLVPGYPARLSCYVSIFLPSIFELIAYSFRTRWLTNKEKAVAVYRLQLDAGTGTTDEEDMSFGKSLKLAVSDYKMWMLAFIQTTKTTAGAVTSFIPTVVNTFGFSKVNT